MKIYTQAAFLHLLPSLLLVVLLTACMTDKAELQRRERAMRDVGLEYLRDGDATSALQQLLEAEALYPDDPILQWYLGKAYFANGENDLSIRHFKRAIELKPDLGPAINDLGVVYLRLEDYDAAITEFKKVTGEVLYATPHFPLSNLGFAYYKKKQYDLSASYYLRALDFEPNYPIALRGLGRTYVEMGKGPEAIAALTTTVKSNPEFGVAYYDLGRAYLLTGDYKKAKAAFQKVVVLEPESSSYAREARKVLARLRHVK
jgi:Tfp pilus assembly protein PilF